jgi:hypothetical protein
LLTSAIWLKNCSIQTENEDSGEDLFVWWSRATRLSLFHGELVKKVTACILFILLGLAISVPAFARAGTNSVQRRPQMNSMKKYMKQQKKKQKNARKSQKKAEKNWKMRHHTGH